MPDLTLARKVYVNGLNVTGSDDHYAAYHLALDVLELHAREERLLNAALLFRAGLERLTSTEGFIGAAQLDPASLGWRELRLRADHAARILEEGNCALAEQGDE